MSSRSFSPAGLAADEITDGLQLDGRDAGRDLLLLLAIGWVALAACAYFLGDLLAARFLDLPLGVYLAGQGVFMALVVASVRIVAVRNGGYSRSRSAATSGASAGGIG